MVSKCRVDRLARSTLHLCQIADILARKSVHLKVVDQNIDTSDATGRLLFNMLAAISQFENEIRTERQMEGIIKAKENGVGFGRKQQLKQTDIVSLHQKRQDGIMIKDLMREYKLSKATIYRYLQSSVG